MSMYARGSCCVRACVCLQADHFQEVQRGVENMLFEVSMRRKLRLLEEKQVRAKNPRAPSTTVSYGLYKKNKKNKKYNLQSCSPVWMNSGRFAQVQKICY